jgi:type II secretory pathway pseudopilin PulG
MTFVELMISMLLLGIASAIFLSVLASVQKGFERQSGRSINNDQARLAMEQLDHEIRSGNLLYDPALESDPGNGIYPGMSLRIYTQVNADIRDPGNQCVQWRILNGQLQNRYWATTWREDPDTEVSPWQVIAEGIANLNVSPQVSAFTLDPDPAKGGRTIVITLLVNNNPALSGSNVSISQSVTGRNTEFGYPSSVCEDVPP